MYHTNSMNTEVSWSGRNVDSIRPFDYDPNPRPRFSIISWYLNVSMRAMLYDPILKKPLNKHAVTPMQVGPQALHLLSPEPLAFRPSIPPPIYLQNSICLLSASSIARGTPSTATADALDILVLFQRCFGDPADAGRVEVRLLGLDAF